ncbi:MAG: alpha/beta fold hydrolase [Breznakibacter sp.]
MGQELHYTISGKGTTILFLHGYCDNSLVWAPVIEQLHGFRTIAVDLPGHGQSRAVDINCSFAEISEAVFHIVQNHNIDKLTLVGHSMGGYVAVAFAKLYPHLVERIFLVHSHPLADSMERKSQRQKEIRLVENGKLPLLLHMQTKSRFGGTALVQTLKSQLAPIATCTTDAGALWALTAMMGRENNAGWLAGCGIPFVCALSPCDVKIDYRAVTEWVASTGHGQVADFNNSRHMCFWEEPELFLKTLLHSVTGK